MTSQAKVLDDLDRNSGQEDCVIQRMQDFVVVSTNQSVMNLPCEMMPAMSLASSYISTYVRQQQSLGGPGPS